MAKYLVEDTSLTAVADAIRTKGGTTGELEFPGGFVSAVEGIQAGGGDDALLTSIVGRSITKLDNSSITEVGRYAFKGCNGLVQISLPNATSVGEYAFDACSSLSSVFLPKVTSVKAIAFADCKALISIDFPSITKISDMNVFMKCKGLKYVNLPICTTLGTNCFKYCSSLEFIDFPKLESFGASAFEECTSLNTIVLRHISVVTMSNSYVLNNTPFASGGTGGIIYIPQVLYNELGTGSALDYKSATNWSTIDSYGTITWMPIEGSEYE